MLIHKGNLGRRGSARARAGPPVAGRADSQVVDFKEFTESGFGGGRAETSFSSMKSTPISTEIDRSGPKSTCSEQDRAIERRT